jgi:glycosyltransferase involved in cell wall biosynthesis
LLRFLPRCLVDRPALAYIHVGSNASLYRETLFILCARFFRIPVVSHFHAGDVDEYLTAQPPAGRRWISLLLGLSNLLIAVSDDSAARLRRLVPATPITVIVNSINPQPFFEIRRGQNNDSTVNVLFVGAMGKLKGERDLAEAIAAISARHPNLRAAFLGFGADDLARYAVERGIARHLTHVGPVAPEKRLEYFANADIFVLPTYAEAMPMSVIEAMAAGLPVISTTVGGIPELIDDGREGYLLEPGDAGKLAVLLSRLASNSDLRRKMGAAARAKVGTRLDFGVYTAQLGETLETVAVGREQCVPTASREVGQN